MFSVRAQRSGVLRALGTGFAVITLAVPLWPFGAPGSGGALAKGASCVTPTGAGPGFDATITAKDTGQNICIIVGERLLVALSAPTPSAPSWQPVSDKPTGVLAVAPLTLMLARGVTASNFRAVRKGQVVLSSTRSVCSAPAPGTTTCGAIERWQVEVIVRGPRAKLSQPKGTGIYGIVSAGPTCPVQQAGRPCPTQRVAGALMARSVTGSVVATGHSDKNGRYSMRLQAGRYILKVTTHSAFPRCPNTNLVVRSGPPRRVDVHCDTGIR